jgi:hypothetical protein
MCGVAKIDGGTNKMPRCMGSRLAAFVLTGLLIPSATGHGRTDDRILGARLVASAEMALTNLGYRIDWPDGLADPQSEAALVAVRAFLALPADTPLRPSLVEALTAMARARADGMRAAADSRRLREQNAIMDEQRDRTVAVSVAGEVKGWDR